MNEKYKTNLVGYGEEVSLLIGELDSCLGDWLHGAGHVVIPGEGDSESHDGQGTHDDTTHMVTPHSPLGLLGELGSLYQFILLCHDGGFWKWSEWVTWGLWSGLVTCTRFWCYNRWLGGAQAMDRPPRHRRKNGLILSKTGTHGEIETRPRARGGVRQAYGSLTWCCLWAVRALLEDSGLTGYVCHSFCLHWLVSAWAASATRGRDWLHGLHCWSQNWDESRDRRMSGKSSEIGITVKHTSDENNK